MKDSHLNTQLYNINQAYEKGIISQQEKEILIHSIIEDSDIENSRSTPIITNNHV